MSHMPDVPVINPAERAAEQALDQVLRCVADRQSFVLEAGAGAGKTYSLIKVLQHLISERRARLLRHGQRIACITYTNVAKDEIDSRTDRDPVIYCETIHSFCWSLMKDFQVQMCERLPAMEKWTEKLQEVGCVGPRRIQYTLGHRAVEGESISVHHDDVIALFCHLMRSPKFRSLLVARFPILLIDEYQDMNGEFAAALKTHFLGGDGRLLVGLFGDHWQQIYSDVCGKIEHPALLRINKGANFRSVKTVVDLLNRMRPELTQAVVDPEAVGSVSAYHTNDWKGKRLGGPQWKGDLPSEVKQRYVGALKALLISEGWSFAPESSKILMLTHKALAAEQKYETLAGVFDYSSSYIDKEDPHIRFFADVLEPVCVAFKVRRFAQMFSFLGSKMPAIRANSEKLKWSDSMHQLLRVREEGTVGEVIDHLVRTRHPQLPEDLEDLEKERQRSAGEPAVDEGSVGVLRALRGVRYAEVIRLVEYLEGHTVFSTKHGVKGAEFENVLVIVGMGWNRYNFNQMLEWAESATKIPQDKRESFERARNLFYVCCSRPKRRLAVLFTQELSKAALATVNKWFGESSVHSLGNL